MIHQVARRHDNALTEAGAVHTFGHNDEGQLGHGDVTQRLKPKAVTALAGEEVAAGVGQTYVGEACHSVVRLAGGELRAFGRNELGQFGQPEPAGWWGPLPRESLPVALALPAAAP